MNYRLTNTFQWRLRLLSISIGAVFLYFGALKFFPDLSPAEQIGATTVCKLCFGLLPPKFCLLALASLEVSIGAALIFRQFMKVTIIVAISHLVMTFTPLLFYPDLIFQDSLISPTLLGQYIYKNVIIICALLVIYPLEANPSTESVEVG